jgi:phospholipase C
MKKLYLLAVALILAAIPTLPAAAAPVEDASTTTPIKHVVWLMQDNHSFDNYFGTYPGADGIPSGVCQRVSLNRKSTRGCVQPFHLGNAAIEDLSQGPAIQERQYNKGRMDGFVAAYRRLGQDGTSAMGYYDGTDIPFHWNVADQYVLFDRFFASTAIGSREAYLYWLAGNAPTAQTTLKDSTGYDELPTIFDRLAKRDIAARFYVENLDEAATRGDAVKRSSQLVKVPLLSMKRFRDGGPLAGQVVDLNQYYTDLRNDTLPAVSYIVTTASSENPPADPAAGSRTVRKLTSELMKSSAWSSSAFMWTYDGWGGWYDHVTPPKVDSRGYGFRVPALLLSPYAKRGVVDHTVLDYTAMLKFIESNWQLKPLSTRDKQSAGLASAFDFSAPARSPALLPSVWPDPETTRSTAKRPAPVIYSVYGVGVALAIAVLGLATFRRQRLRIPVPVRRAAVLLSSRMEAVRDRLAPLLSPRHATVPATVPAASALGGPARRSIRFPDWDAAGLAVPRWPRPSVPINGQDHWADWYRRTNGTEGADLAAGPKLISIPLGKLDVDRAGVDGLAPETNGHISPPSPSSPQLKAAAAAETEAEWDIYPPLADATGAVATDRAGVDGLAPETNGHISPPSPSSPQLKAAAAAETEAEWDIYPPLAVATGAVAADQASSVAQQATDSQADRTTPATTIQPTSDHETEAVVEAVVATSHHRSRRNPNRRQNRGRRLTRHSRS